RNADNKDGLWWIWRDGLLMTPNGLADTTIYTRNAVYLGPAVSGSSSGIVDIDYIRLTNGAFAPVPEPGMLTFLSLVSLSLLAIRRKAA
ncbi:MAG: hypothetical protein U9N87_14580, partial [Planctomycetota bacterium]|nr:hypothetical protein [Planctomycetota bacterium]